MTVSNFAPHHQRPRRRIEPLHRDFGRKRRSILIASQTSPSQWPYAWQHARILYKRDPTKTKHEAFYGVMTRHKGLHLFGAPVVIKILPKPTMFQPRAVRGRWFGIAGERVTSVHRVSIKCTTSNADAKTKVVRSRNIRFLDATFPDDSDTTDPVATVLKEDHPLFSDLMDTQGRSLNEGPSDDECSGCSQKTPGPPAPQ